MRISLLFVLLCATIAAPETVPSDPYFKYQWALSNNGTVKTPLCPQTRAGADMKSALAWDIEKGDSAVVVAIIDCGCKMDHPEFAGRFWVNKGEIPGNGIDDDSNGYVDDINGWNFSDNNSNLDDTLGHGTGMASIIGANVNNGIGIAGIDWYCKLMTIKVGESSPTNTSDSAAIEYAVQNGASIINYSIGFLNYDDLLNKTIKEAVSKGVIFVASSGNDRLDTLDFPASIPEVIAVGSTNPDDTWSGEFPLGSGGSSYGKNLDVVAPGNCIRQIDPTSANEYGVLVSGTSSSTAFVTGLAALLLAQDPSRTPAQIERIITMSADDGVGKPEEDTPGWDKYHGWGRINMYRALKADTARAAVQHHKAVASAKRTEYGVKVHLDNWSCITIRETRTLNDGATLTRNLDLLGRLKGVASAESGITQRSRQAVPH